MKFQNVDVFQKHSPYFIFCSKAADSDFYLKFLDILYLTFSVFYKFSVFLGWAINMDYLRHF